MAVTAHSTLARSLIGLAALGLGGTALARDNDSVAGALLGAGAGAIIGHSVGGPDAAVAGGIIGALTGAAVASHRPPAVAVHYGGGYGYAPPVYYPSRPRGPVFVVPPPAVVFVPNRGHGYWRHGFDAWGRPLRTWIPVAPPRYYAPPVYPRHYYRGDRGRHGGW